jgi:hypothetical protein
MDTNRFTLAKLASRYTVGLLLAGSVVASPVAGATVIGYTQGHGLDTGQLGLHGDSVINFSGAEDAGLTAALAASGTYDVLMIGESTSLNLPYDPANVTALQNYVSNGGEVIVTGAHNAEDDFLNAMFGFSTVQTAAPCCETSTFTIQPGVAGTAFAGGPATLTDPSYTPPVLNAPGTVLYANGSLTAAFMAPYGAGTVVYLAWDFCCGNTTATAPWYDVLDRALEAHAVPTPGSLALLVIGAAAAAAARRRNVRPRRMAGPWRIAGSLLAMGGIQMKRQLGRLFTNSTNSCAGSGLLTQ